MLEENKKLIYQVINDLKYIPEGVEIEDLEQEGMIALWKAIECYDENSSYALSTHCYRVIRGDIIDWLRKFQAIKRKDIPANNEETYTTDFENEIIGNQITDEMKKYLSERDVNILVDKYVNHLSQQCLANKYNMSLSGIYKNIVRSKQILKDKMKWEE